MGAGQGGSGQDGSGRPGRGSRPAQAADPTRDTAFDILVAVTEQRRPLDDTLDRLAQQREAAEARDRAAGHRLAACVLRRAGTLDAVLEPMLAKAPPPRARLVLQIGAAQLLFLGTPAHAAVATAVALARRRGLAPFAGLVNAVLRRLGTVGGAALEGLDTARLDTPAWLWSAWGPRARAIAAANLVEAPLDLTLVPGAPVPQGGIVLPTGTVRLPAGSRPAELEGFAEGRFWVQDAAAALPARLLGAQRGERVADLCAAPGGKTAQLALTGAEVVAVERDPRRLERLRQNLDRLRLDVSLVQADAAQWRPAAPLDAILLDAPCSATGTIRRHPDALRLKRPQDVRTLAEGQDRLIAAAAAMLRPGGRMVYAVCSMQPEEGPARIARAVGGPLGDARLRPVPLDPARLAALGLHGLDAALTPEGALRTDPALWPEAGGMDGFFMAVLERTG